MQECRIEKNISKQEKQIADTHRSRLKTEGKKLNLEIFDSEGDRGSREDNGKDAGAVNYVTDLLIMITKIVLIMMMVVTHSDDNDYDNCGDGSLPLFVLGPLEK